LPAITALGAQLVAISPDYTQRPDPEELLPVLQGMQMTVAA